MIQQSSRILALSLFVLGLLAADVRGEQREPEADFWAQVVDPGRRAFEGAMERGGDLLQKAKQIRTEPLRGRVLEDALAAFRSATQHSPNNYRGWLRMADVLAELGRTKHAITALQQTRALDPPEAEARQAVAFALGIAYSKVGDFEKAVLEYDRADQVLAGSPSRGDRAMLHGNAAEALMALGRLDEAIQRYRESLSYGSSTLTRFGLAVAYDRDEQISKALQEMRLVLAADSAMRELTRDTVFFIPEGDIHYYFALGYQCKGETEKAKTEWQLFLQQLPRSQWAPRARAHLAELGVAGQVQKARKTLAPVPRVTGGQEEASSRDQAAVRLRMNGYLYRVRGCYSAELRKHPTLAGELRLSFVVQPNGRADGIKVVRSTIKSASLTRCVTQTIKSIYFSRPISARAVRVEYPLKFEP